MPVDEEDFGFLALRLFHLTVAVEHIGADNLMKRVILAYRIRFALMLQNFLE